MTTNPTNLNLETPSPNCPNCGAPLDDALAGHLCPACLIAAVARPTESGVATQWDPAPSPDQLSVFFPQLEIVELIGQGGMGAVYKARQPHLDRWVALKVLPASLGADPAFAERFSREARVLAKLNHPNIVTLHDFGEAHGHFYLLMEYVDGVNLRQAIRSGGFTPEQALSIVPKICEALQFAHSQSVLHRDIKPANILLDSSGRVKIADFGIAKVVGQAEPEGTGAPKQMAPELTAASTTLGTPSYMAPEQLKAPASVDHRADIYSLGVVFYEMLTGELPSSAYSPPSRHAQMDHRIDDVVKRALAEQRESRQQSAEEMRTEVETIVSTPNPDASAPKAMTATVAAFLTVIAALLPLFALVGLRTSTASIAREQAHAQMREAQIAELGAQIERKRHQLEATRTVLGDEKDEDKTQLEIDELERQRRTLASGSVQIDSRQLSLLPIFGIVLSVFGLSFGSCWFGWRHLRRLRAAGSRRGVAPAMFSGLLLPLLALDAAVFALIILPVNAGRWENKPFVEYAALSATIVLIVLLDWYFTAKTWRWVTRQEPKQKLVSKPLPLGILAYGFLLAMTLFSAYAMFTKPKDRVEAPMSAATVSDTASTYCAYVNEEMRFILYYRGSFDATSSRGSDSEGGWRIGGQLSLNDGPSIDFKNTSESKDTLFLNGKPYSLRQGRVFILFPEPGMDVEQRNVDPGIVSSQDELRRITSLLGERR